MATAMSSELSNEDWLVMRARSCFSSDPYAAKAWMLTARTLFPKNFNIQFEAYSLEKQGKNCKEAAKLLESLYLSFPDESKLWSEVHSILEALQNDTGDYQNTFLTEILAAIPTHVQCQMLLSVSQKITDKLEQCRLLLLAMRKFPDLIKEHGLRLIEALLNAESQAQYMTPVNCFRKLLICDALPLILQKGKQMRIPSISLYLWLQKSVEFYISFVTQPPSQTQEPSTPLSPEIMSPTKKTRRLSIAGLQDRESLVSDPWGSLFKLLVYIGQNLGWDIETEFFNKSREFQYQHILSLYNRSNKPGSDGNNQILYTTTVLFLECLYHYIVSVDTDVFYSNTSNSTPLVIIEGFKEEQAGAGTQPPAKRLKAESLLPQIHATDGVPNSTKIIQNFLTAFKCYELLNSSADLQREFSVLCKNWRMETWSWMGHFQTDMFLYQGAFQDAARHLQNFSIVSKSKQQIRHSLQLACCFYSMNNFSKACELVLDVITALPASSPLQESSEAISCANFVFGSGRHLVLVPCSESQLLPYCIQLLVTCFREKVFGMKTSDVLIGHTMVLLQYDWPTHESLFNQLVKKIAKQGSFSYNTFFNYIINVDILEEFAFLKTQEEGKVNLDILPISTSAISQQRTVTRGVNKGVTEDFKVMMEKQVRRSDEHVETIIRQFLNSERSQMLSSLL